MAAGILGGTTQQISNICAMVKSPTFNDGILIMGPYKPLRDWVDEFIPYYMAIMGVWHISSLATFLSRRIGPDSLKHEQKKIKFYPFWKSSDTSRFHQPWTYLKIIWANGIIFHLSLEFPEIFGVPFPET